jgi:hypothetical protein
LAPGARLGAEPALPASLVRILRATLAAEDAHRRRALRRAILMGLLAATGLAVLWHPLTALMAAVTIAFTGGRTSLGSTGIRRRRYSERLVTELLTHLPDDHVLVNDVVLPDQGGTVDHVVIGPCGVLVIETRHGTEGVSSAGFGPGSHAALAVKDFLAERHHDLRHSALRFVDSVVVFTDPRSPLEIYWPRTAVVRYSELLQFIRELARQRGMDASTAATLAHTLRSVSAPRTAPSRESSDVSFPPATHRFRST